MKRLLSSLFMRAALSALLVLALLLPAAALTAGPRLVSDVEADDPYSLAQSYLPEEGAYRLRNVATGRCLTAFPLDAAEAGGCYICDTAEDTHQIFVLARQSDLSYTLVSECEGSYLAAGADAAAGSTAVIVPQDGASARFSVTRLDDGSFLISPLHTADQTLALCAGAQFASDGITPLAAFTPFSGAAAECWLLEPVPLSAIAMTRESLSMTVGQSTQLEIVMTPARIDGNVFWSSDNAAVTVDTGGRVTALKNGAATVTATLGSLSASCTVTVSDISAGSFFSQHNFSNGGWNVSPLTSLRFSGKLFAIERYNGNADWMDEGCKLCCDSMLLRNLGARMTTGYDFRTGQTDDLTPDPYIVALANTGNHGATGARARLYGDPVSIDSARVMSRFTVNGSPIAYTTRHGVNLTQIKNALEEHPEGVIVEFYRSKTLRHFLVFTECVNPDDPSGNYDFIVCDPAAYDRTMGDHVLFENSISYRTIGYRYRNIVSMSTISVLADGSASTSLRGNRISDYRIK